MSEYVHGFGAKDDASGVGATELFATVAMMNHCSKPNCVFLLEADKAQAAVIVAARNVKKGEELTMLYLEDEAKVRERWNL